MQNLFVNKSKLRCNLIQAMSNVLPTGSKIWRTKKNAKLDYDETSPPNHNYIGRCHCWQYKTKSSQSFLLTEFDRSCFLDFRVNSVAPSRRNLRSVDAPHPHEIADRMSLRLQSRLR